MSEPTQNEPQPSGPSRPISTVGLIASLILTAASLVGCMFFNGGDIARSHVPRAAQEQFNLPETTSHNKSLRAYQEWRSDALALDRSWSMSLRVSAADAAAWDAFGTEMGQHAQTVLLPFLGTGALGMFGTTIFAFLRNREQADRAYDQGAQEALEKYLAGQQNAFQIAQASPSASPS